MDEARSLADLGAALYPAAPAAEAAPVVAAPASPAQATEPAADALPPEIQALRDADPARAMYSDTTAYASAGIDTALGDLGITGAAAEAEHKAWAGVFTDVGLTTQDAQDVVKLALMDEPNAEEMQGWRGQAEASLQETYGADDWQQALADARLLVKRDPRLKDFLNRTGLGDHPHVVKLAAQRAREQIASGKLKRS